MHNTTRPDSASSALFRWAALLLCTCLVTIGFHEGSSAAAAPSRQQAQVIVNGKPVDLGMQPFVERGITFAPLRQTAVALGADVKWNAAEQTSYITWNGDTITHRSGSNEFVVNGFAIQSPAPSRIEHGKLLVPLRSLTDALKAKLAINNAPDAMHIAIDPDAETTVHSDAAAINNLLIGESFSGLALVAQHGEIKLRKGFGIASDNRLTRPEMKTRVASITKSITATAIMTLIEQGKLKPEDTLDAFIPDFPRGDEITIHMLLSHTSGLPSNFTRAAGVTLEQTVAEIKTKSLDFEPGSAYKYSNCGYILLAYLIEELSGMEYEQYLQTAVFGPSGMKSTGEIKDGTVPVKGHLVTEDGLQEAGPYYSQSGTGTLYSTLDDLLKWTAALQNGQLLTSASLEQMFTPYSDRGYGYGWMIKSGNDGKTVFHNGSGTGYSTGISVQWNDDTVLILLGNKAGMDMLHLLDGVQQLAKGKTQAPRAA
ncbi:hypothetical protein EBB07_15890 [Paenibacillaceae bacterium]|nr:hypothetical protein EBB07_15890 [Paenibacillaceae bacterium]